MLQSRQQTNQQQSSQHFLTYFLGDERVNEQIGLTSMHTMFVHEHNEIAHGLSTVNPHWNDERIYKETRRIVAAQHQHITYGQFLPAILGPAVFYKYGLSPKLYGFFDGYDSTADATIFNEFAAAAYR